MRRLTTVVSRNRPTNVAKMYEVGLPEDALWVISGDEMPAYQENGAHLTMHMGTRYVTQKRRAIVEYAWEHGYDEVVMVDDDLRKCVLYQPQTQTKVKINLTTAIDAIAGRLDQTGLYYGGIGPTDNAYFVKACYRLDKFVRSNLIVIRKDPAGLNFDTDFVCKADYDLTCQHIQQYGGAVRCDELLLSFPYKTNAGGCQDYRNMETHMEAIVRLEHKWPGVFRRNKRRPGEVVLKWPTT